MSFVNRKVFISHYKGGRKKVDTFIDNFCDAISQRVLGANDNDEFIDSTDTEYIMQRILEKYLEDSTVTIVLLGSCTHSRRYVDWKNKSSLLQGNNLPNGLIGIALPSQGGSVNFPDRLAAN